jgi:hypothetical protein
MKYEEKKHQCNQLLIGLVGKDMVQKWWASPNRAFNGMTPFVAFENDPDVVRDYLVWHAYCVGG